MRKPKRHESDYGAPFLPTRERIERLKAEIKAKHMRSRLSAPIPKRAEPSPIGAIRVVSFADVDTPAGQ